MRPAALLAAVGLALLVLSVLPSPRLVTRTSATDEAAEYGRQLFFAKGCVGCHFHAAAQPENQLAFMGFRDLTGYDPDPEFVRQWLRDPGAVRPGTEMPNLNLSDEETEALIAFLDGAADVEP